ncbi:24966_t:CDS:1, partial [Dentiscutata erythropus]
MNFPFCNNNRWLETDIADVANGLDEIDPILSYDPLDPMQVQAVYKDLKDEADYLVQSIHGNTKHLEIKLVYYLDRYDQTLNPYDHKTIIKKRKCGDGDQSVSRSN